MNILVACEESQVLTIELRKRGHNAFSCDIEPCSGGHPEWHIQSNVLPLLSGNCSFVTADGSGHRIIGRWDMIIAFPPCTYLSNAGAVRLRVNGELQQSRMLLARYAKAFFMDIYNADCDRIVIENPVPGKIHELPKYSQIIEPYMFGDHWKKRTCLWLRGVPILMATEIVVPDGLWVGSTSSRRDSKIHSKYALASHRDKTTRSKTFPGIARAMAEQWTDDIA